MKMRYWAFILGLLAWGIAQAGTSNGGGGIALVCSDGTQNYAAYLLDLYEATATGVTLRQPVGNLDLEYSSYLKALRAQANDFRPVNQVDIDEFHAELKTVLMKPGELPFTGDVGSTIALPPGCRLQQAAIWDDTNDRLTISTDIWNLFDSENKIALWAHELTYKQYREALGDWSSQATRKTVPLYFSTTPAPKPADGVPITALVCDGFDGEGQYTEFFVYANPKNPNESIFRFSQFFGLNVEAPLQITIPEKIPAQNLVAVSDGFEPVIRVDDPNANYIDAADVEDGYLPNFQVGVSYRNGQTFSLALFEKLGPGQGEVSDRGEVRINECKTLASSNK